LCLFEKYSNQLLNLKYSRSLTSLYGDDDDISKEDTENEVNVFFFFCYYIQVIIF